MKKGHLNLKESVKSSINAQIYENTTKSHKFKVWFTTGKY